MEDRDIETVRRTVQAAMPWKGKDAELDQLLGDALANVLMKPNEGLVLLQANPAPENPSWLWAISAAILRSGDLDAMRLAPTTLGVQRVDFQSDVVDQVVRQARMEPRMGWDEMVTAVEGCKLLDGQPTRGRQPLDIPATQSLFSAADALHAELSALGRPATPSDEHAGDIKSSDPIRCNRLYWLRDTTMPENTRRGIVAAAVFDGQAVYIDIQSQKGALWAVATNDSELATSWLDTAHEMNMESSHQQPTSPTLRSPTENP